jgi:hypothetical protein
MWAIEFEEPEGGSLTLEAARPDPARTRWLGRFDDRQACAGTDVGNGSPRAGWEYLHPRDRRPVAPLPTRRLRGHRAMSDTLAGGCAPQRVPALLGQFAAAQGSCDVRADSGDGKKQPDAT